MTLQNSKKTSTVLVTALLIVSIASMNLPFAHAAECIPTWDQHCYGVSKHDFSVDDKKGGQVKMKYVAPTTLKNSNGWLSNPLWLLTDNAKQVEVGWFDGYPVGSAICYTAIDGTMQQFSGSSPSASLATYEIHDSNGDNQWTMSACSNTRTSSNLNSDTAVWIQSGYETTHDHNDHNLNT